MERLPKRFGKGSRGEAVAQFLAVIHGICIGQGLSRRGEFNYQRYDDIAVSFIRRLQTNYCQSVRDGCFGPEIHCFLRERGFDFPTVAYNAGGTNVFVLPDGSEVEWTAPRPEGVPVCQNA
ncbi:MAG: hypothetical protein KGJ13_01365 [Patescibacteria group bacterium]|nr:hypothetical protein [Patescibacteria group bacterium]